MKEPRSLATSLLAWYKGHGRSLPWRGTQDPYRILVSEIMLQQTQVPRGLIFYPRWLARFPTWEALAAANNAEAIEAWVGLGYNRRALMLRNIAQQIVDKGAIPKNAAEWQALKGIGPYTAAALACFASAERVLPIDTNIRRVLGRVFLGEPFPDPTHDEGIREKAGGILPETGFQDVPQALFDLATLVCTKTPDCAQCPLRDACPCAAGFLAGTYAIPKRTIKKANESRHRDKPYPDRIYRGRILKTVREEAAMRADEHLGKRIDPAFDASLDLAWLANMVGRLSRDGMLHEENGELKIGTATKKPL